MDKRLLSYKEILFILIMNETNENGGNKMLTMNKDEILSKQYSEITNNIKRIRLEKNISIEKLAEMADIDKSHIYKIENGSRKIGLDALLKLTLALDVRVSDIIKPPTEETAVKEKYYNQLMLAVKDYDEVEVEAAVEMIELYLFQVRQLRKK